MSILQQFLLPLLGIVRTVYTGACIPANETANQQSLTYYVLLVHLNTCMWLGFHMPLFSMLQMCCLDLLV